MSYEFEEEELREEAAATFRRRLFWGIALVAGVAVGGYLVMFGPKPQAGRPKAAPMTMVMLPPPPPPPPPPPKKEPEPPKEEVREDKQEMVMQDPIQEDEPPPAETAAEAPAADLGTGITGNGPADGFGLNAKGSGNRIGGRGGIGRKSSPYGWFGAQVQKRVGAILRAHPYLKTAEFQPTYLRIYADSTGRAMRVSLDSTGDPKIDEAIRQALTGTQVTDALLGDRPLPPMPIVMRLKAARPN